MPSVLEGFIEDVTSELDDGAIRSLKHEVNGIQALAILRSLETKGSEVRNPSAFVHSAARTCASRPTTHTELAQAFEVLKKDATVDDQLIWNLDSKDKEVVTTAVSAYLQQDQGVIENASAYITRNLSAHQHKSGGSPGMGSAAGQIGTMGYSARKGMSGLGAMQDYRDHMSSSSQSWRADKASGAYGASNGMDYSGHQRSRPTGLKHLMEKWSSRIDPEAMRHLQSVGQDVALEVLQEMDGKQDAIRNPSAYVQNTIRKRQEKGDLDWGQTDATRQQMAAPLMAPTISAPQKGGSSRRGMRADLDAKALAALDQIPSEAANDILADLDRKGPTVHNPSAFVFAAATKVQQAQGSYGQASQDYGQDSRVVHSSWSALSRADASAALSSGRGLLDSTAQAALDSLSPEAAQEILDDLEKKGSTVLNPSAFVMSAASKRHASGQGYAASMGPTIGAPRPPTPGSAAVKPDRWESANPSSELDSQALDALATIEDEEANAILQNLESMLVDGKVANPSAYVTKAVRNVQMGLELKRVPGSSSRVPAGASKPLGMAQLAAQVEESFGPNVPEDLDQQALDALETLSPEEQTVILESLNQKAEEGKVRNPSAFVSTAVRNVQNSKVKSSPPGPARSSPPISALGRSSMDLPLDLDQEAQDALAELGEPEASNILKKLNVLQNTTVVHNASAFVTKAARAAMGSKAPPIAAPIANYAAAWRSSLDAQALEALQSLDAKEASALLHKLETTQVRNPSAFVTTAVRSMSRDKASAGAGERLSAAWRQWRNVLDRDASDALMSLDVQEQLSMLDELNSKAQQLRNPSAYVIRGVQHLRQGGSASKRPRL